MKENVSDAWTPALRENQLRSVISSDIIRDLETRDLSTNDYDVLLQLDEGGKRPIQDFLVSAISGIKVTAENAKTFGHVFHESCLARSVLSQMYACPYPGCGHALLPGLLYVQQNHKPSKTEQQSEPKQKVSSPAPVLDPSFTVLGLQNDHKQSQLGMGEMNSLSSRKTKRKIALPRHRDSIRLPSLPGLVSVSIISHENPHDADARRPTPVPNQLEHENNSNIQGTATPPQSSLVRVKGRLGVASRNRNIIPPLDQHQLPVKSNDASVTENRLNHAQKIRAELKAIERHRLEKQRLAKEERRQRHKESSNKPAFTGGFLIAVQNENVKTPRTKQTKLQSQEQCQEAKQLPVTLPDLFIANKR
ncbi:unnamed protein product [Phytophthora fragariaefolia]|uniref:Unnamed protein product n=1 Tax=Phytophthora fragariaefolia TaxID=1490495 RepID=A0A9W7CXF8_9STRA|nr:unnamed protein product [Phytophthora fragariaefolia]